MTKKRNRSPSESASDSCSYSEERNPKRLRAVEFTLPSSPNEATKSSDDEMLVARNSPPLSGPDCLITDVRFRERTPGPNKVIQRVIDVNAASSPPRPTGVIQRASSGFFTKSGHVIPENPRIPEESRAKDYYLRRL